MNADDVVRLLDLKPHPEGGFYRETFRDGGGAAPGAGAGGRSHSTAIYYLLREGEQSRWHRVNAAEVWHWYGGEALELLVAEKGVEHRIVLGPRLDAGERPQAIVPAKVWQSARPLGSYALVGCTVAPGFEFAGFELAPKNWQPEQLK